MRPPLFPDKESPCIDLTSYEEMTPEESEEYEGEDETELFRRDRDQPTLIKIDNILALDDADSPFEPERLASEVESMVRTFSNRLDSNSVTSPKAAPPPESEEESVEDEMPSPLVNNKAPTGMLKRALEFRKNRLNLSRSSSSLDPVIGIVASKSDHPEPTPTLFRKSMIHARDVHSRDELEPIPCEEEDDDYLDRDPDEDESQALEVVLSADDTTQPLSPTVMAFYDRSDSREDAPRNSLWSPVANSFSPRGFLAVGSHLYSNDSMAVPDLEKLKKEDIPLKKLGIDTDGKEGIIQIDSNLEREVERVDRRLTIVDAASSSCRTDEQELEHVSVPEIERKRVSWAEDSPDAVDNIRASVHSPRIGIMRNRGVVETIDVDDESPRQKSDPIGSLSKKGEVHRSHGEDREALIVPEIESRTVTRRSPSPSKLVAERTRDRMEDLRRDHERPRSKSPVKMSISPIRTEIIEVEENFRPTRSASPTKTLDRRRSPDKVDKLRERLHRFRNQGLSSEDKSVISDTPGSSRASVLAVRSQSPSHGRSWSPSLVRPTTSSGIDCTDLTEVDALCRMPLDASESASRVPDDDFNSTMSRNQDMVVDSVEAFCPVPATVSGSSSLLLDDEVRSIDSPPSALSPASLPFDEPKPKPLQRRTIRMAMEEFKDVVMCDNVVNGTNSEFMDDSVLKLVGSDENGKKIGSRVAKTYERDLAISEDESSNPSEQSNDEDEPKRPLETKPVMEPRRTIEPKRDAVAPTSSKREDPPNRPIVLLNNKRNDDDDTSDESTGETDTAYTSDGNATGEDTETLGSKVSMESDMDPDLYESFTVPFVVKMLDHSCAWLEEKNADMNCGAPSDSSITRDKKKSLKGRVLNTDSLVQRMSSRQKSRENKKKPNRVSVKVSAESDDSEEVRTPTMSNMARVMKSPKRSSRSPQKKRQSRDLPKADIGPRSPRRSLRDAPKKKAPVIFSFEESKEKAPKRISKKTYISSVAVETEVPEIEETPVPGAEPKQGVKETISTENSVVMASNKPEEKLKASLPPSDITNEEGAMGSEIGIIEADERTVSTMAQSTQTEDFPTEARDRSSSPRKNRDSTETTRRMDPPPSESPSIVRSPFQVKLQERLARIREHETVPQTEPAKPTRRSAGGPEVSPAYRRPVYEQEDPYASLTEEERLAALELAEKLRRRAATLKRRREQRQASVA